MLPLAAQLGMYFVDYFSGINFPITERYTSYRSLFKEAFLIKKNMSMKERIRRRENSLDPSVGSNSTS